MTTIQNKTFDEERALYAARDILVQECAFDGPADGESAFKEGRDIAVNGCFFNLRYPFWHDTGLKIEKSEMTELCRAALWYSENMEISDTKLHGIKALRECANVIMRRCACHFSGVRLVRARDHHEGLHRAERVFHDAL